MLSDAWELMGRYADAEAKYRHILAGQLRTLGPGHPDYPAQHRVGDRTCR
jgi:hypothetical protein